MCRIWLREEELRERGLRAKARALQREVVGKSGVVSQEQGPMGHRASRRTATELTGPGMVAVAKEDFDQIVQAIAHWCPVTYLPPFPPQIHFAAITK